MKVIIVSGCVGCGKTRFAKKLALKNNYKYVNLTEFINKNKLFEKYDRKRDTYDVDVKKLNKALIKLIKDSKTNLVIDGHLSHYLPKRYVERCYIVKCELKELEKRLEKRGYSNANVRENLDAEIFDVCLEEAKEMKHKINVIDTGKKVI